MGTLQVVHLPANGDELVIGVGGELDLGTAPMFVHAIDEAVEQGPVSLVLDLSDLTFIDSSGVGAYVTAFRRARRAGCRIRIGDRSTLVDRVLQIAGVEEALAEESEED